MAEITFIRLRTRAGAPAGSLAPALGLQGNRAVVKVATGDVFPVLVDSLPADLRKEYDAFVSGFTAWVKAVAEELAKQPIAEAPAQDEEPTSDLADMHVADLKKLAARYDIEGRSGMDKEELVEALGQKITS